MSAVDLPAVPRVLIAEADPWSRDLLKQVLLNVRCDARLDMCGDGRQAATLLRDKAYDLIVADWELPGHRWSEPVAQCASAASLARVAVHPLEQSQ